MPYAHKLDTYPNDAYKPVVYCIYCGQEENLNSPCSGEYQLSSKEQKAIDDALREGFKEIFGSRTEYGSKFLNEVLDRQKIDG